MNVVNVSSARTDAENIHRAGNQGDFNDDYGSDDDDNRRVSLNSNSKSLCRSFYFSNLIFPVIESAGNASNASELTASTAGPQTPHSLDDMSPHHAGPRAKASAIYVQPGKGSYRAFGRPSAKGSRAFLAQSRAKKAGRATYQRKSDRGESEDDEE